MRYKLLAYSNPVITIDGKAKKELMELMNWTEEELSKNTEEIDDEDKNGKNS